MAAEDLTFKERFWDVICEYDMLLKVGLSLSIMLLILLLIVTPWIPRDSPGFIILVLDLVLLVPLIGFLIYLIWRCRSRERRDRF